MLDAVLLVLREVLEAALFVSLLMALASKLGLAWRWERIAVPLGLAASWIASRTAGAVAEAFDGIGQELLNGALYVVAIASFVGLTTALVPVIAGRRRAPGCAPCLHALFVAIVACSMMREGSEVWIYLSGFVGNAPAMSAALMGGLIGTGIGLSVCALVYYAFSFLGRRSFLIVFFVLAALVVGGLSMQVAKLALQIGWLDGGNPLWDSSWLVGERSWFGQLLHALFGYDANPDGVQAGFYFASLLAVGGGAALQFVLTRERRHG